MRPDVSRQQGVNISYDAKAKTTMTHPHIAVGDSSESPSHIVCQLPYKNKKEGAQKQKARRNVRPTTHHNAENRNLR